jgi:hypothetical protein
MALRTIRASAESKGKPVFAHFKKPTQETVKQGHINIDINEVLENMGAPQFSYDTFKETYDSVPQIEQLVDNFNSEGIFINSEEADEEMQGNDDDKSTVSQMAKAATDLSDN